MIVCDKTLLCESCRNKLEVDKIQKENQDFEEFMARTNILDTYESVERDYNSEYGQ